MRYDIIAEPPLESVIKVAQRGMGFLSGGMERKYLETTELITCAAIYARAEDTQLLCHIDRNPLISAQKQAEIFMRFAECFGIDAVYSICSLEVDAGTLKEAESVFAGFNPERITVDREIADIIFDSKGRMYEIDPMTVRGQESLSDGLLYSERLGYRKGLLCTNTGTVIGYEDIGT